MDINLDEFDISSSHKVDFYNAAELFILAIVDMEKIPIPPEVRIALYNKFEGALFQETNPKVIYDAIRVERHKLFVHHEEKA
jgi:hypothetical protein